MFDRALADRNRVTMPIGHIMGYSPACRLDAGGLIGYFDEDGVTEARRDYGPT